MKPSRPTPRVAFRVDADERLGAGSLVRCVALAEALRRRGAQPHFIARRLPDAWAQWLHVRQLAYTDLGAPLATFEPAEGDAPHAPWLGTSWAEDARQTRAALGETGWDWLVVDHCALDARWEQAMRPAAARLMAIDDLGDRLHEADVLLEPGLRVATRVPGHARRWVGPRQALLREQFAVAHRQARLRQGPVQRVLVFFGGADTGKATGKVLRALDGMRRDGLGAFMVDAVVSALHPEREALVDFCARRPGWACHVQTDRMADLMAAADLAVGAGGGTLWERCAVGLPAVVVPKNPAQGVQVAAAAEAGLVCAPRVHGDGPEGWRAHIEALWLDDVRRRQMSARALASVDGRGAERVARAMLQAPLGLRPQAERPAA